MDSLDQLVVLSEVLEDAVQYVCDEHMMSGEMAWSATATLASLKLNELTQAP